MLTISRLMDALTNPAKMKMSQNRLATAFNTSASTINAWVNKDTQPHMSVETIYNGIKDCRETYPAYQNETDFVEKVISYLDLDPPEKDSLNIQFKLYKNKYSLDGTCGQKFLMHMIQLALDKAEIKPSLSYDPFDPVHPLVGIGAEHLLAVQHDGRVLSTGVNDFQQCDTYAWRNIVSVACGWRSSLGLKADGTCIAIGRNVVGNGEIYQWNNLTAICCGPFHFLGLRRDGTVVAYGLAGEGQCNVSDWSQIRALAAGLHHTVGLREDGTVVACGSNREGQCEVSSWQHVKQIAAANEHTVGLTEEGTILYAGDPFTYDFTGWTDIQMIATGNYHIVGLKKDGTVINTGNTVAGLDHVYKWWDMKAIYAAQDTTAGIKADGSVLVTNDKHKRYHLNTASWNIYDVPGTQNNGPSPFEEARKNILSNLESIRDIGFKLIPALHESSLDEENRNRLKEICRLSRESWEYRETILQIKPLAGILLNYGSAFLDFQKRFTIDEKWENVSVSADAYDTCIEFLTAVKMLLIDVRSI